MQDVIYVACDDSGAEAKGWILEYLDAHGYAWRDCGGDETPSRYPYYAAKVAAAVSRGEIRRGILICGSGIGVRSGISIRSVIRSVICIRPVICVRPGIRSVNRICPGRSA